MMWLALLGAVLVLLGAVFCIIGSVGLLRFPDVYARLHAAGVGDTLGASLVTIGLMLVSLTAVFDHGFHPEKLLITFKLVAILFFMWVSGTTACHALAKAAHLSGLPAWGTDDEASGGASSTR